MTSSVNGSASGKEKQHADLVVTLENLVGQETMPATTRMRAAVAGRIVQCRTTRTPCPGVSDEP